MSAAVLERHTDVDTPFVGLHSSPSIETSLVAGSSMPGALRGVWRVRALPPASCGAKAILPRPTPGSYAKLKYAGSPCEHCRRTEFAKCHHEDAYCEPGLEPGKVPRSLDPERVETALGGETEGVEFRSRSLALCSCDSITGSLASKITLPAALRCMAEAMDPACPGASRFSSDHGLAAARQRQSLPYRDPARALESISLRVVQAYLSGDQADDEIQTHWNWCCKSCPGLSLLEVRWAARMIHAPLGSIRNRPRIVTSQNEPPQRAPDSPRSHQGNMPVAPIPTLKGSI